MATVEQQAPGQGRGAPAASIAVENPATGETITSVPTIGAEQIAEMAARARAAQPAWDSLGFENRGRIMRRAQKWMLDHADRVLQTVVAETPSRTGPCSRKLSTRVFSVFSNKAR